VLALVFRKYGGMKSDKAICLNFYVKRQS